MSPATVTVATLEDVVKNALQDSSAMLCQAVDVIQDKSLNAIPSELKEFSLTANASANVMLLDHVAISARLDLII